MTMSKGCGLAIAILALAGAPLGCGGDEDSPDVAPAAKAPVADEASAGQAAPRDRAAKAERRRKSPGDKATKNRKPEPTKVVKLPENFPDDVPIYPGSAPTASLVRQGGDAVVSLRTDAAPKDVLKYYQSGLGKQGWQVESEIAEASQSALVTKKDRRTATVLVMAGPAGTQIVITIAEE